MMFQQLVCHTQQTIQGTSVQDLDPRPCPDNDHTSVMVHEPPKIRHVCYLETGTVPAGFLQSHQESN